MNQLKYFSIQKFLSFIVFCGVLCFYFGGFYVGLISALIAIFIGYNVGLYDTKV